MKASCLIIIGFLAILCSGCVTGDEITSCVIAPDGSMDISIYRLNLTSDQTGEKAKEELAGYIGDLEGKRGDLFTKFAKANVTELRVAVLRKTSPASVLITGRIPSLKDLAIYDSQEDEDSRVVCSAISRERLRGIQCELIRKPAKEKTASGKVQPVTVRPRADSFEEIRVSLAEGTFTRAQGYIISQDKRSALFDIDALIKKWNARLPSITYSLEWQVP